ncbi:ester cyclase [candidate division KSB1 bacterium]|nr:ester cyclase [candidate division KSB1 bacterium]
MRTLSNSIKAATGLLLLALVVIIAGFLPMSFNQGSQVGTKSLVKKTVDAFNNRTPELAEQAFAPKFIYHPGSATESSEQTIRSFYDNNLATYPDFKGTLEDVVAEGNKAAARIIFEGTHKEYGKKIRAVDHWIGRVEGGKFVEVWELVDALTWYRQLGYTITPPEQQASANQAQVEAINKLREQELAAFSTADVNALLKLFTDDAIVMPPNESALFGQDAIRAWLIIFTSNLPCRANTRHQTSFSPAIGPSSV